MTKAGGTERDGNPVDRPAYSLRVPSTQCMMPATLLGEPVEAPTAGYEEIIERKGRTLVTEQVGKLVGDQDGVPLGGGWGV